MGSGYFQKLLRLSVIPQIQEKYPYRHRFFMSNDPKHTSKSISRFMLLNNINHFPTPRVSLDVIPFEMVWNDLKFYLVKNVKCNSKKDFIFIFNIRKC